MSSFPRERATGAGMESAIVFATRALSLVGTVGVQALLAWMLAPEGRGAYAVCYLFGMLFGLIFTIGVDRAGQHFVMNKEMSVSHGVTAATVIAVVGSIVAMGIGWLFIHTSISYFQKAETSDFELSLLLIPASILNSSFQFQQNGLRRFVSRAVITVVQTTTNLLFVVMFLAVLDYGVKGALAAQVISLSVAIVLQVWDLGAHCGYRFVFPRWSQYRAIALYGARYFVARIGNTVDARLGVLLLGFMATQNEIGLFSAASALSLKTMIFAQSIEVTMLPRIASNPARRDEIVRRSLRLSSLLGGVTLLLLVVASVPLVQVLLSPSFLPAVPLIWILAPGILFQGWSTILIGHYRVINRPGFTSWSVWIGLTTNAVLFVMLYPTIGLTAAAWSNSLGFLARFLVLTTRFRPSSAAGWSQTLWPQRQDIAAVWRSLGEITARATTLGRARHERP